MTKLVQKGIFFEKKLTFRKAKNYVGAHTRLFSTQKGVNPLVGFTPYYIYIYNLNYSTFLVPLHWG